MGLSLEQWEDEIKELNEDQIKEISKSIDNLMQWDVFRHEYEWTGLSAIKSICDFLG